MHPISKINYHDVKQGNRSAKKTNNKSFFAFDIDAIYNLRQRSRMCHVKLLVRCLYINKSIILADRGAKDEGMTEIFTGNLLSSPLYKNYLSSKTYIAKKITYIRRDLVCN